jgi:hypothetical protein
VNRSPNDARFRDWLTGRAPRSAPPGILARSLAELERDPRQLPGRWGWSAWRSLAVVPAVVAVIVVAAVTATAIGSLRQPAAVGDSTTLPTASPKESPTAMSTPTESPTPSVSPTSSPTQAAAASHSASPSAASVQIDCSAHVGEIDYQLGGNVGFTVGDFTATEDMCLTQFILSYLDAYPTAGTMTLTRDGTAVWSLDITQWGVTGSESAGSGERSLMLATPIGVAAGQTLALVFSDCSECLDNVGISFVAVAP